MISLNNLQTIFALQSPFGHMVSVWRVDLDAHYRILDPGILTASELDRSERMTNPVDARRFIASRHALRILLASYTACNAEDIRYRLSDFGKPQVLDSTVDFNLSRSQGHALIACGAHRPVGVDIEMVRPVAERDSLIQSTFSDAEKHAIQLRPTQEIDEAFLEIWVRKEACLKALGLGLSVPLSCLTVDTGLAVSELCIDCKPDRWRVEVASIDTPVNAVAALAVVHG